MSLQAYRNEPLEVDPKREEAIYELLSRYGFSNAVWRRPLGHKWSLIGEVEGMEVVVSCLDEAGHFHLQVQNPRAREWLLDLLAEHDFWDVDVRAELVIEHDEPAPWIALTVVIGAVALFGWVVSSIGLH